MKRALTSQETIWKVISQCGTAQMNTLDDFVIVPNLEIDSLI